MFKVTSQGQFEQVNLKQEKPLEDVQVTADYIFGFDKGNMVAVGNMSDSVWQSSATLGYDCKMVFVQDPENETIGIGKDGSVVKVFLNEGLDNADVEAQESISHDFKELQQNIHAANKIVHKNLQILSLPLYDNRPAYANQFYAFNGAKVAIFQTIEQVEEKIKEIGFQISPAPLNAIKYILNTLQKNVSNQSCYID